MTNELQLLIETLEKKIAILDSILEKSRIQSKVALEDDFDAEQFDRLVDEKTELLQRMEIIDQGFDAIYERIKNEMLERKDDFKHEIGRMQQLIGETIDLGAQIHATEIRIKEHLSIALQKSRQELKERKASSKSVMDYYKANSQLRYMESYFIDQKK